MAIPKVCGIETEYGILVRGGDDNNPVSASSLLINAYLAAHTSRDGRSAGTSRTSTRATTPAASASTTLLAPEIETHLVNAVLTNGARYYVDHAHPEISTPECRDARVRSWCSTGPPRRSCAPACRPPRSCCPTAPRSCATRTTPTARATATAATRTTCWPRDAVRAHRRTRSRRTSSPARSWSAPARSGCELPGVTADDVPYQISQRADFFEEEVGLETTLKRPIVNTRDEPHCDADEVPPAARHRRRREHERDRHLSEGGRHGDRAGDDRGRRDGRRPRAGQPGRRHPPGQPRPVAAAHHPAARRAGGRRRSRSSGACSSGRASTSARTASTRSATRSAPTCSRRGRAVLTGLEHDPDSRRPTSVDWVAKRRVVAGLRRAPRPATGRRPAEGARPAVPRHAPRQVPGRAGSGLQTMRRSPRRGAAGDDRAAHHHPGLLPWSLPGEVAGEIVAANWDSLVFDIGRDPLRRVPMMEPLRGTAEHVARLIDESDTAAELLARLGRMNCTNRAGEHHGRANAEAETGTEPHRRGRSSRRPPPPRTGDKLKAELDDLLDEIDDVLETNAEDFVKSYVQKGGQ